MTWLSAVTSIGFLKRYGGTLAMIVMWAGFFLVVQAHGLPDRALWDALALSACGLGALMVLLYG